MKYSNTLDGPVDSYCGDPEDCDEEEQDDPERDDHDQECDRRRDDPEPVSYGDRRTEYLERQAEINAREYDDE